MAMTIKNNFAILNLVKTFLTSITFDSLSRKIKNPCLVINKIYLKGVCKMTHTKNILKSLLITVMALSLLAVSCKKDENGGGTPTNPTTTTIGASDLTGVLQSIVIENTIDFSKVTPASGKASVTALTAKFGDLKTALDGVLAVEQEGVTVAGKYSSETKPSASTALDLTLTITAKSGYVLDDKMTEYTYNEADKTASVVISIKPSAAWED